MMVQEMQGKLDLERVLVTKKLGVADSVGGTAA